MALSNLLKRICATTALVAMAQMTITSAFAQDSDIVIGPPSNSFVGQFMHFPGGSKALIHDAKLALLRQKIKYVFVLFQENRSFDHYFGTYPGAVGLFTQPASQTPGFKQPIVNTDGSLDTISPFLIPLTVTNANNQTVQIYPADTDSIDHSHSGIVTSIDVQSNGDALNDRFALDEEGLTTLNGKIVSKTTLAPPTTPPTLAQKQKGELALGHLDCTTVPFLWQYADRFTLYDNFAMSMIGPSAPNAIAMIAGQTGETQWALHPTESASEPVTADVAPFPGSNKDTAPGPKPPFGPNDVSPASPTLNQTYASLPLSFMGRQIHQITGSDENPAMDLLDVADDIEVIARQPVVPWGWYQEGFDHEPTDGAGPATHDNYITHHEAPQYFGYLGDNSYVLSKNLKGLGDFFTDIANRNLPNSGVFYVRGGYGNNDKLTPVDKNTAVQANFTGNDDHPGYSDAQISEALIADEVNAIASSPYWKNSVIIITYDETDGMYDHQPPRIRVNDPQGEPLEGGSRIPALVISPYSLVHSISHVYSEPSSVIKFIDGLFNLTRLAELPDEERAQALGQKELDQDELEPADARDNGIGDLTEAFDDFRLLGLLPPLDSSYAIIPDATVKSLPHYNNQGCNVLHVTPTDIVHGVVIDPAPADFNPRPSTTPGTPTSAGWNG